MKNLTIIYGDAAIFIPSRKALVIADLHIGIEYEFYEKGIHIGSRTFALIERIERLMKMADIEEVFILGDVKHVVPSSPPSQRKDIEEFFERLNELTNVTIIPGNHDGGLRNILPSANIKDSSGYVLEDESIGLIHGHRWPSEKVMQCSTIITAHTHPTVSLRDGFGYEFFERCWVVSKLDAEKVKKKYNSFADAEVIVMPAFNPICGGVPVNREGIAGPVSKMIDLDESDIYLLDGSALGKIKNLR
ncbi:MAG: metallophosphoesterase [Thermoplasmata archaeon]|nr:metallophosphoesterase [Thermoplasmata archaeon]